jgi:hypothetical protein
MKRIIFFSQRECEGPEKAKGFVGASLLRDHNHVEDRRVARRKGAKVA